MQRSGRAEKHCNKSNHRKESACAVQIVYIKLGNNLKAELKFPHIWFLFSELLIDAICCFMSHSVCDPWCLCLDSGLLVWCINVKISINIWSNYWSYIYKVFTACVSKAPPPMAVHWAGRPFHITWDGGVSLVTGGSCPDLQDLKTGEGDGGATPNA
jgi:hypothetical protein